LAEFDEPISSHFTVMLIAGAGVAVGLGYVLCNYFKIKLSILYVVTSLVRYYSQQIHPKFSFQWRRLKW